MELPPLPQLRRPTQSPARCTVLPGLGLVGLCLLFFGRRFSDGWHTIKRRRIVDCNRLILHLAGGRPDSAFGRGRKMERVAWV
jgi:hypothetical protein